MFHLEFIKIAVKTAVDFGLNAEDFEKTLMLNLNQYNSSFETVHNPQNFNIPQSNSINVNFASQINEICSQITNVICDSKTSEDLLKENVVTDKSQETINLSEEIPQGKSFRFSSETKDLDSLQNTIKVTQSTVEVKKKRKTRIKYTQAFLLKFNKTHNLCPEELKEVEGLSKRVITWTPNSCRKFTSLEQKLNKIKSDLNKLCIDNEEKIISRVCKNVTLDCLNNIVPFIFEKGIWDMKYRESHCKLIEKLSEKFPEIKKSMIDECQRELTVKIQITDNSQNENVDRMMQKRLNTIRFISVLLKIRYFNPNLILLCFNQLLPLATSISNSLSDEDLDLFHAAELLLITYPLIKNPEVQKKFDPIFDKLKYEYHLNKKMSVKTKFRILDAFSKNEYLKDSLKDPLGDTDSCPFGISSNVSVI